jgi:hypothetical protein
VSPITVVMSWPRAMTLATSRALVAIISSDLRSTVPAIATPHGLRKVANLSVKVASRALASYSPRRVVIAI